MLFCFFSSENTTVLVRVLKINRIHRKDTQIDKKKKKKELAYVIIKSGKYKICRVGCQAKDSGSVHVAVKV